MIYFKKTSNLKEANALRAPGYKVINVLSWHAKDTRYYELCPYYLKTEEGALFENDWQARKLFEYVYDNEVYPHYSLQGKPQYLWWKYECENGSGREKHYDKATDTIMPEYFKWKQSLLDCPHPVRYPNKSFRTKLCQFALDNDTDDHSKRYGYIDARKNIYCNKYKKLVRELDIYNELLQDVKNGVKILITEVDVPCKGKKGFYGLNLDENNIYQADLDKIQVLLNDPSEAFGHGICLAYALLEDLNVN